MVCHGELPPGLAAQWDGYISGIPTTAGTYNFTINVSDYSGNEASTDLSITIDPPPLEVTPAALAHAQVGRVYNQVISGSGGTPPYTLSLADGDSLPGWALFDVDTGVISGTPGADDIGMTKFTIQVEDSLGVKTSREISIRVLAAGEFGNVFAWGYNYDGHLGLGIGDTSPSVPIQVSGIDNVIALAGGSGFSLALDAGGKVWAWAATPRASLAWVTILTGILPPRFPLSATLSRLMPDILIVWH